MAVKQNRRYAFVPEALWGKFPNSWVLMLDKSTRIVLGITVLSLGFLILYATLLGPPFRSDWAYLLTAGLGPLAAAVWYIIFPLNPYRGMSAIREGLKDLDKRDQDANKLVMHLKSLEARRFLLNTAWKVSVLFVVPMALISAGMGKVPTWHFGADCAVRIPAFLFICMFIFFRIGLLSWSLKSWGNVESGY